MAGTTTTYKSGDISDRLWHASAREARFIVMNAETSDEHVRLKVALSLGLATEYLIMSALASLDVSMLAEGKSVYSKLALSKANTGANLDIKQLRTVTYGEALKLLLHHEKFVADAQVTLVMNTRNAAAHMAMVTQEGNEEGLRAMVAIVAGLQRYLTAFKEDDYWGPDCLPVVQNLRDEHANKIQARYNAHVLAAKDTFKTLDQKLSSSEREHVYTSLEARLVAKSEACDSDAQVAQPLPCPACARTGSLTWTGYLWDDFEQVVTYEAAMGNDAPDISVTLERVATAFECLVCGLILDGEETALLVEPNSSYIEQERYILSGDELASYYEHLAEFDPGVPDFESWK